MTKKDVLKHIGDNEHARQQLIEAERHTKYSATVINDDNNVQNDGVPEQAGSSRQPEFTMDTVNEFTFETRPV